MKCQNCGKLDANFHYRSNVNGQITEQHLCQECAATMEGSVFARVQKEMEGGQNAFESFFNPVSMFCGNSMWDNMTRSLFNDFWRAPQIVMISPAAFQPSEAEAEAEAKAEGATPSNAPTSARTKNIPADAGDKFKKRREINRLRSEMKAAVKDENFERAAELRDRIYNLEKESAADN